MKLTSEQVDFFETFGFIMLPGILKDDVEWITKEFEQVFPLFEESSNHTGDKRTVVLPFIDQRKKLSALLDDPRILGIARSLLGDDFNYVCSDGNYYSGDTNWHRDGRGHNLKSLRSIKIAFYLDQLDGDSGALRVIPGSQLEGSFHNKLHEMSKNPGKSLALWGIAGSEVPAQILDVTPGDLLVFDHNTFHAAFGGGRSRRMFTINLCQHYPEDSLDLLKTVALGHCTYRRHVYYGPEMMNTDNPERLAHLKQILSLTNNLYEESSHLPELHRRTGDKG